MWIVQALVDRGENELFWLRLVSGLMMLVLAFWTSGQFFIERALRVGDRRALRGRQRQRPGVGVREDLKSITDDCANALSGS
jgi:hypothetical protein